MKVDYIHAYSSKPAGDMAGMLQPELQAAPFTVDSAGANVIAIPE